MDLLKPASTGDSLVSRKRTHSIVAEGEDLERGKRYREGNDTTIEDVDTPLTFLDLPAEIRNRVYDLAIEEEANRPPYRPPTVTSNARLLPREDISLFSEYLDPKRCKVAHPVRQYTGLSQTCRQLRKEFKPLYLAMKPIRVSHRAFPRYIESFYPASEGYKNRTGRIVVVVGSWDNPFTWDILPVLQILHQSPNFELSVKAEYWGNNEKFIRGIWEEGILAHFLRLTADGEPWSGLVQGEWVTGLSTDAKWWERDVRKHFRLTIQVGSEGQEAWGVERKRKVGKKIAKGIGLQGLGYSDTYIMPEKGTKGRRADDPSASKKNETPKAVHMTEEDG